MDARFLVTFFVCIQTVVVVILVFHVAITKSPPTTGWRRIVLLRTFFGKVQLLDHEDAVEDTSKSNVIKRLGHLERKAENMDRKLDLVIKMLHDSNKVRSDRASSFTNTRLSPDPGRSLETLEQKPPRGPAISRLKPKSKSSRFKVTIIDSKDSQDEK